MEGIIRNFYAAVSLYDSDDADAMQEAMQEAAYRRETNLRQDISGRPPSPAASRGPAAVHTARTGEGGSVDVQLRRWLLEAPPAERDARRTAVARIEAARLVDGSESPLDLSGLGLTSLPGCLSALDSVELLDISDNRLSALPALPPNLEALDASNNLLRTLPTLPFGLTMLVASANRLTRLPPLPGWLDVLHVSANKLTELPWLPPVLTDIEADFNELSALPRLPAELKNLSVARNRITNARAPGSPGLVLPEGLREFDLRWNPLHYCPTLPNTLNTFSLSTHALKDFSYLRQLSGLRTDQLSDTHVCGDRDETARSGWEVCCDDYSS